MSRFYVVGIAGTAKNTGKTTALTALLTEAERVGLALGLTSIGYDGEMRDNITGLPKPRIHCLAGLIVAIAESCLTAGSCRIAVLERTSVQTPLGAIVIGKITRPGLLVIAGPNKTRELSHIISRLGKHGAEAVFVDGALNRIAPLAATDGIILSTGAARTTRLEDLAGEAEAIDRLLNRPAVNRGCKNDRIILADGCNSTSLSTGSLLTPGQVTEIMAAFTPATKAVYIPGAVNIELLQRVINSLRGRIRGLEIIFSNAFNLLIGGEAHDVQAVLEDIERRGGKIAVQRQTPLLAVTVNPFYPSYRREGNRYRPSAVDADELLTAVRRAVRVPVADVKRDGAASLFAAIRQRLTL